MQAEIRPISKEEARNLMSAFAVIFGKDDFKQIIEVIHELPKNNIQPFLEHFCKLIMNIPPPASVITANQLITLIDIWATQIRISDFDIFYKAFQEIYRQ
jgi:hypothetical protein